MICLVIINTQYDALIPEYKCTVITIGHKVQKDICWTLCPRGNSWTLGPRRTSWTQGPVSRIGQSVREVTVGH